MRVRFFVFFLMFSVVLPLYAATTQPADSGSSQLGKPSVKFKSWQVGRSPKGTVQNTEQLSFITSTEEECYFTASVVYDGNQGDNVSPIDPLKVTWSIENESHGMALEGNLKKNWSGDSHPSKLAASTSFNVVGKLSVPQHIGTSKSHCPNYGGSSEPLNGRADTPMTFTIKFSAKTEDGQDITPVELVLLQDEKDEMRQEYMDMARKTTRRKGSVDGNVLRVPSRSELGSQNDYDDGHYSYMMGKNVLPKKHTAWTEAFKKHAKEKFGNTGLSDLVETGGYRNPHHHYYHVPNGSGSPRGWHQFGLALDVRGRDIDINKDNKKGTLDDREEMAIAAKRYAGASWTKHTYTDGHVHAQWEWEGRNKERASTASPFSLPLQGTDSALPVNNPDTEATRPCGHLVSASGDHSLQASCSATNRRGKSCTVTNFYACQSHTHTYPKTPLLPLHTVRQRCQRALLGYTCSKGGYTTLYDTHGSRCRLWHSYWDCDPASVEKHKVRTCVRCNKTYQNCDGGRNPCISGLGHTETVETSAEAPSTPQPNPSPPSETPPTTSPEESDTTENEEQETEEEDTTEVPEETTPARPTAVCGSGHTYSTDRTFEVNRHKDQTCLRCSQTYQNCSNSAAACQSTRWHTQDATAYMEGACGHSHRINEKSQHASVTCTTTNANGDMCNGGSYYACQSHTHTYPAPTETPTPSPSPPENSNPNNNENEEEEEEEEEVPTAPPTPTPPPPPPPPPPTTVACGAASWTKCTTDVSSSTEHQVSCSGGHSYWTCGTSTAWHQDRTCTRCSQTYQNCGNSATACQSSKWHTETPQVVLVACGAASWTGCTSQLTSSTAHQVTCSGGHSYWTCGTAVAWHQDRTCTRCRQTYQNCGNSATACQGSRWHRE